MAISTESAYSRLIHTMERYKRIKQHEMVTCPECGAENRAPGSILLSDDTPICPDCEEIIGHTRKEGEWSVVREESAEL